MLRVFLADDEPWILISMKKIIDWSAEGFVICGEATDGVKAWERIQNLKPDVVITDIKMPEVDGLELIKRIREVGLDTDVVILSGYSDFQYARTAIRYDCSDYLIKPVDEEELLEIMRKIAQKHDPEEETGEEGYASENSIIHSMLAIMREEYKTVSQQMLADEFHMSVSAVSNLFKKNTGRSYSDHLLEIRVEKAEQLLRTTNDSIEQIAEEVGYNDYFYFMKIFKKATGMSASKYRKNL